MDPCQPAFDASAHLTWRDVTRDGGCPPNLVHVFLKQSKTDQIGRDLAVYLGTTGDDLCRVTTLFEYVRSHFGPAGGCSGHPELVLIGGTCPLL